MSSDAPLSVLAASLMENDVSPSPSPARLQADHMHDHVHAQADKACGWSLWHLVFYFLVFGLVFYFLYFALRPSFVLEQNCHSRSHSSASDEQEDRPISNGRLLAAAVISALLLLLVLWIFWALFQWMH